MHIGGKNLRRDKITIVLSAYDSPNTVDLIKPHGGFWTSTFHPAPAKYASDWVEWCAQGMEEWLRGSAYLIEIAPAARIYTIDSLPDLERMMLAFDAHLIHTFPYFDWGQVAEKYDGIHLTSRGQWRTRLSIPSLYGWDSESTVWLNNVFADVRPYTGKLVRKAHD